MRRFNQCSRGKCESNTFVYLVTYMKCLEQYVGSAIYFKNRFCIHKYDAKAKKEQTLLDC